MDEFWIALGKGDEEDRTREEIESINSDKINVIDTIWNTELFSKNTEFAQILLKKNVRETGCFIYKVMK